MSLKCNKNKLKVTDLENILVENAFQEFKDTLTKRLEKVFDDSKINGALDEYFCVLTTDDTERIILKEMTTFDGQKLIMPLKKKEINETKLPNTIIQILENHLNINGEHLDEESKMSLENDINRVKEYLNKSRQNVTISEVAQSALTSGTTAEKVAEAQNLENIEQNLDKNNKGVTKDD